MDKFLKKRKKEDDYVFVVAPGASGGDCPALVEVLSSLGKTVTIKKWVGNFPSQMKQNVELLRTTATAQKGKVVLVGHSFGCRVIVALLREETYEAVLESYPLYGPSKPKNAGTDRVAPLKTLKGRVLFFVGDNDPFYRRDWHDGATGPDALFEVLKDCPLVDATTVVVEGAGHNVLKVAKKNEMRVRGTVRTSIQNYLEQGDSSKKPKSD